MPSSSTESLAPPASSPAAPPYAPPKGARKTIAVPALGSGRANRVRAEADWLVIREHGIPVAEVFFTSYQAESPSRRDRPVMFLFNGGPGAASAFLHMGTAGPMRVEFGDHGSALPPPASVVANRETWLKYADLVFVDPVGTGLSRTVAEARLEQQPPEPDDEKREKRLKSVPDATRGFFKIKRDIDVLAEFVAAFLSRENRWHSPVYIAGESYGGFRVGKLLRALPDRGIGLCGAMMVSPAIDFLAFNGSDYDSNSWLASIPTMALAASHHKKSRGRLASMPHDRLASAAEAFAIDELAPVLIRGDFGPSTTRARAFATLADLIGLPLDLVERFGGRVTIDIFARELLRDQNLLCGLYDAAITGPNIFPQREAAQVEPDPTLAGITSSFTSSVNVMLRRTIGLQTSREYHLMNHNAWKQWVDDRADGYWHRQLECADDTRYGLAAVPGLRLLIAHGTFDLVTTFTSSKMAVACMRLPSSIAPRVQLKNYAGGHMFYTWAQSRKAVLADVGRLCGAKAR